MAIDNFATRPVYLRCSLRAGLWNGTTMPTQFSDAINFTELEITPPEQEDEELLSNMIEGYGTAIDSQPTPTGSATMTASFNTLTPHMINLALGATVSEQTQTTAGVTDELVTTAVGVWVKLANKYLSESGFSLKTNGDVAVDPSKYEVDYVNGYIKAIHADAAGTDWKASYTTADRTWEQYDAGQAVSSYVMLTGQARDQYTGMTGRLTILRANLSPNGGFTPVSGGYLTGSVTGKIIAPTGYTAPYIWEAVTA